MADLAVIILTFNEEKHIARAIRSVQGITQNILVVDSHSTDQTVRLARDLGAVVLENTFINYAKQFHWAMEHCPFDCGWLMRLDADEYIEADLARKIEDTLPDLPLEICGINLKRKHIFMGRWIRHGGRYPLILLRLWRQGTAEIEDRWMDEHMVLSQGKTATMEGGFCDHNLNDLQYFIGKHNNYATREAVDVINNKYDLFSRNSRLSSTNSPKQAIVKRYIKENIYNKLPFSVSSTLYFSYRYFFQLGFLDGIEGSIYHFLQGYWYRFLVGAKTVELERALRGITDKQKILRELAHLTGLRL